MLFKLIYDKHHYPLFSDEKKKRNCSSPKIIKKCTPIDLYATKVPEKFISIIFYVKTHKMAGILSYSPNKPQKIW